MFSFDLIPTFFPLPGMDLQLVGHLRGQMFVLQDWYGRDASLRWDGPSMKVQDFWSPGGSESSESSEGSICSCTFWAIDGERET